MIFVVVLSTLRYKAKWVFAVAQPQKHLASLLGEELCS